MTYFYYYYCDYLVVHEGFEKFAKKKVTGTVHRGDQNRFKEVTLKKATSDTQSHAPPRPTRQSVACHQTHNLLSLRVPHHQQQQQQMQRQQRLVRQRGQLVTHH